MSLERMENKLDQLLEMTVQAKIDLVELKSEVKVTNNKLEDHISQDEKIIARMTPMIEHYEYNQKKKLERIEKMKTFGLKATYITVSSLVITSIYKLILFFKSLI